MKASRISKPSAGRGGGRQPVECRFDLIGNPIYSRPPSQRSGTAKGGIIHCDKALGVSIQVHDTDVLHTPSMPDARCTAKGPYANNNTVETGFPVEKDLREYRAGVNKVTYAIVDQIHSWTSHRAQ